MKKYYLDVLTNKYSNFNGRARRKEYWMWTLSVTIVFIFAMILDNLLGLNFELMGQDLGYGWIYLIAGIAHLIPGLAVVVRRLHDVGKSGWFYFIVLIPIIGILWMLILLCSDGKKEDNKWGRNPKTINL
tara:strand:+ start:397 stop:786 length:390 start_codon:yes stop_codon:yes gene_type:complete